MNAETNTISCGGKNSDAFSASDQILCETGLDIKIASTFELKTQKIAELRKLWIQGVERDTNAVGWLPTSVFDSRAQTGEVTACYRNEDLVGWLVRGESRARKVMKIYQIWVRPDARIIEHGKALVRNLSKKTSESRCHMMEAWVAEDLAANLFWKAIGFQRTVWRWGRGQSLRKIFRWVKMAEDLAEVSAILPPTFPANSNYCGEFFSLENYVHK